ncbi:MAG: AAA ATPase [Spirochaetes bacterium]|nr:MAG: AAA ATPase [Spirochaetota bacterium]
MANADTRAAIADNAAKAVMGKRKALAKSMGGSFRRIQCTPELPPSDVMGFSVNNQKSGTFVFHPSPVIPYILLADKINRTIPRESALARAGGKKIAQENLPRQEIQREILEENFGSSIS